MRARIHAFARSRTARGRKNLTSDGSRTKVHRGWVPRSRPCFSSSGSRFHEWVGIFTVHKRSFFGFDFSHFSQKNTRVASAEFLSARSAFIPIRVRASSAHGVARTADDRREPRSGSIAKEFDRREPAECAPRTRSRVDATDA